jgi:hypothetical protein
LLRAVLSELPTREVVQLLTVDRSTLREGVAILYRHLDARDGLKGIGEANHGLGDDDDDAEFSFDGTQTQGTASQQANKVGTSEMWLMPGSSSTLGPCGSSSAGSVSAIGALDRGCGLAGCRTRV